MSAEEPSRPGSHRASVDDAGASPDTDIVGDAAVAPTDDSGAFSEEFTNPELAEEAEAALDAVALKEAELYLAATSGSSTKRRVWRAFLVLFMFLIVIYLVLPQLASARGDLDRISSVTWWLLPLAVLLEVAAMASYSGLTMATLPGDRRHRPIKYFTLFRIQLSVKSVTNLVPGGSATGAALGYRMLTNAGVRGTDAGFAMATVGLGSAVVLNLVLWVSLLVSLPRSGFQPGYAAAAIAGAIAISGVAALVVLLVKGQGPLDSIVRAIARKVPRVTPEGASKGLARIVTHLRELAARPDIIRRGIAWATANWLFDAAALWVCLAAFGQQVPADSLLVAFGIANVLAVIPITPGGLLVVEGALITTLVGFGVPATEAGLAVITYRLAQFWLPIPLGGLSYLSLKVGPTKVASRRERMRELATEAVRQTHYDDLP